MKTQGLIALLITVALAIGIVIWAATSDTSPAPVGFSPGATEKSPEPELAQRAAPDGNAPQKPKRTFKLSNLATAPDYDSLKNYDGAVTRSTFLRQVKDIYSVADNWRPWLDIGEDHVEIVGTGVRVEFAKDEASATGGVKYWDVTPQQDRLPLAGLHIVIDPGHIGGDFAKMEERFFQIDGLTPAMEGEMTLVVARKIAEKLTTAGASVTLTRTNNHPVTPLRPKDLREAIIERYGSEQSEAAIEHRSELWFYRTAEIRERATWVNDVYKPDMVICLHFNAEAWGDADNPILLNREHLHLLVNGAYTDGEWKLDDQRFLLLKRIFENTHEAESKISKGVIDSFKELTDLPAYQYEANSKRARNVDANPYLWARNLLATRIYECPVIFLEPYVMNSRTTYERIQAGDYEGTREVAGKKRLSLFEEYARAVSSGVIRSLSEQL